MESFIYRVESVDVRVESGTFMVESVIKRVELINNRVKSIIIRVELVIKERNQSIKCMIVKVQVSGSNRNAPKFFR